MQATTARCLPGGIGRSPLLKELAKSALLRSSSSVTVMVAPCGWKGTEERGGRWAPADGGPGSGVPRLPRLPGPGTAAGDHAPVVEGAVPDQQEGDHAGISLPWRRGPRN